MADVLPLRANGYCACGWERPIALTRCFYASFGAQVDEAGVYVEMTCPRCGEVHTVTWEGGSAAEGDEGGARAQ